MKTSLFVLGLILSFKALAQGAPVPHIFTTGDPIVASEINANYQELSDRNDTTQTQVDQNSTNISGNQSSISTMQGTITQIQNDITNLQGSSSNPLLQFVGISTGTADGSAGIRNMTKLCQADFADSRICTTEEYAKTITHPASIPVSTAWILPSNVTVVSTAGVNDTFAGLYKGGQALNEFACSGWTTAAGTGLTVSPTGGFVTLNCNIAKPVSCCK